MVIHSDLQANNKIYSLNKRGEIEEYTADSMCIYTNNEEALLYKDKDGQPICYESELHEHDIHKDKNYFWHNMLAEAYKVKHQDYYKKEN